MGIVVTVVMLFGLLLLLPLPALKPLRQSKQIALAVVSLLVIVGAWNSVYGLRHWQAFWGMAALVSGGVMIIAALLIYHNRGAAGGYSRWLASIASVKPIITMVLLICFGLYSVTLIQLNLGYPIIH